MGPTPIRGRRLRVVREEFCVVAVPAAGVGTNSYFVATVGGFGRLTEGRSDWMLFQRQLSSVGGSQQSAFGTPR